MTYICQGIDQTFEEMVFVYEESKCAMLFQLDFRNNVSTNSFHNKYNASLIEMYN